MSTNPTLSDRDPAVESTIRERLRVPIAATRDPLVGAYLFTGPGVALGTGALEGQRLHVQYETELADPEDHPCLPGPAAAGTMFIESVRIVAPRS